MAAPDPTVAVVAAGGVVRLPSDGMPRGWLSPRPGTFPWATFLVNCPGSLSMGLLVAWLVTHPGHTAWHDPSSESVSSVAGRPSRRSP